jgi:hypothetical protein
MALGERREIDFDMHAVRSVLEWSPRAAQAFGLPPLTPSAVRGNPAENAIEVIYGDLPAQRVFMLRVEALGAILISYCNRARIPMPRQAEKRLRVERDRVTVVLTRKTELTAPGLPETAIGRAPEAVRAFSWVAPAD